MKWISVKKSKPNNTREVLCVDALGNYFIGYISERDGWMVSMYDEPDKSNEYNPDVTHWCEIKAPKSGFLFSILHPKRKSRK
ncbi:MAG: DUF551 domain-containing protein [Bacteroidales bacterium]|nr:DUF551 domain-containing protein [Bacteroidales bacterium]